MKRTIAAVVLVLAVAGCGTAQPAKAAPKPSPTTASPSASGLPSTTAAADRPAGKVATFADSNGFKARLTVSTFRDQAGVGASEAPAGQHFAAVQVRFCLDAKPTSVHAISLTWQPWTLRFADGSTYPALESWSPEWLVAPLYPNDDSKSTPVGACTAGWVPFAVNNGEGRPQSMEYSDGQGDSARWTF